MVRSTAEPSKAKESQVQATTYTHNSFPFAQIENTMKKIYCFLISLYHDNDEMDLLSLGVFSSSVWFVAKHSLTHFEDLHFE